MFYIRQDETYSLWMRFFVHRTTWFIWLLHVWNGEALYDCFQEGIFCYVFCTITWWLKPVCINWSDNNSNVYMGISNLISINNFLDHQLFIKACMIVFKRAFFCYIFCTQTQWLETCLCQLIGQQFKCLYGIF